MATKTTTKERPILFSGPMVRAILDGRKTQTRRVIKFRDFPDDPKAHRPWRTGGGYWQDGDDFLPCPYLLPPYQDSNYPRLWVRETWAVWGEFRDGPGYCYRADGHQLGVTWKPSIHMPRKVSRITLEVTGVRVERVGDISTADCAAEGIQLQPGRDTEHLRRDFRTLWDSINGKRGYGWATNPWVWVVEFTRVQP
jgi:hypothetical protein